MANLMVGANEAFHTISDAVAASHSGDTLYVQAGTYTNDWMAIDHDLTIIGVGGYAHLVSEGLIDNGKAMMVINANVTIQNLEFSGAAVYDDNGAGIRHESGNLTVLNSYFHDNQEGILAGDNPSVHITVRDSEFEHNGAGDGQSHGLYVGQIASLLVDGSDFHDTWLGNQLKSRAAETTVTNSHFATGPYSANYDIDLPNGGVVYVANNTFDKGETADNRAVVHFGGEIDNPVGHMVVENNQFTSNLEFSNAVLNHTDLPVTVANNVMEGIEYPLWGPGTLVNNIIGGVTITDPDLGPAPVDVGGVTPPPAEPPVEQPPVDVGGETPPVDAGGETPPVDVGGETPPVDVGSDDPPVDDGGETPPPIDVGSDDPPVDDGGADPAPQWNWGGWGGGGGWGRGWWNNPDTVEVTGNAWHPWWDDHTV